MPYHLFTLGPDELERVREAGGPLADLPDLSGFCEGRIIVAEAEGQIVAYWPIMRVVHAEPCWIHPDHRGQAALIYPLLAEIRAALRGLGIEMAFAVIDDTQLDRHRDLMATLGYARVPGTLYYVSAEALGT